MDLLTQEQKETVERIRANQNYRQKHMDATEADYGPAHDDCFDILGVIDSIQPKQYTEAELREAFERGQHDTERRISNGEYSRSGLQTQWRQWLDCARFLGAIKEKEG